MQERKKLNLLPLSVQNKYANKYLIYAASLICGIFILALSVQYINITMLKHDIQKIQTANERYNEEKSKIEGLQNMINEHKEFLESYENGEFPFSLFMHDVEINRPYSVSILSVDSKDRLINEGVQKADDTPTDEAVTEENEENADEQTTDQKENQVDTAKIEYIKDLNGEEIIIRGYGENSEDISKFIYNISKLSYIKNAKITAIEQHSLDEKQVNIFEITVIGGVVK